MKYAIVFFKKVETSVQYMLKYLFRNSYILFLSVSAIAQTGAVTYVHDPCIIKTADYYYIFSTGDRIEMRRSTDIQNWKRLKQVFSSIPEWGKQEVPGVRNIWAPDIFYRDSTYYLYYSLSTFGSNRSRIGLATNQTLDPDSPSYHWIDKGKVFGSNSEDSYNAIDPNIAEDQQGRLWLTFGSFWSGIKIIELDSTTMKPKSGASLYSIAGRPNWGPIEAPYIIYRNGYYYLFVSFDFCCKGVNSSYNIRVGRSTEITGPYKSENGALMTNGGGTLILKSDDRWIGPGHCAVLQEKDETWLVHHAYDAENHGVPTLRIEKLIWDEDDWPVLETATSLQGTKSRLYQNYPNPFKQSTEITFDLLAAEFVSLSIYDVQGRLISTLVSETLGTGPHTVIFNAGSLASSIYFYTLRTSHLKTTKKMILLK